MRIRIDVWASLKLKIAEEVSRTGLSANEIVNTILADHFGMLPNKNKNSN